MIHARLFGSILFALLVMPAVRAQSLSGGYPGGIDLVRVGTAFSVTPTVSGGIPPYSFIYDPRLGGSIGSSTGHFPAGLQLNPTTGTISGIPTELGNFSIVIVVHDSSGTGGGASFGVLLSVISGDLQIGLASLPVGYPGQPYVVWLTANGGVAPYVWSVVSGALPPGLTLQPPPTYEFLKGAPLQAGSWTFTLKATDTSGKTGSQQYTVIIAGVQITTNALPSGRAGARYQQQLIASGGQQPYRWSVASGSLAPGITLTDTGMLAGTPTATGSYLFSARATDSVGQTATASLTLTIAQATLIITTQLLPDAKVQEPWSATLTASGGQVPYAFSILNGKLPAGLELQPSGLISGIPQEAGLFKFTPQVRDSSGQQSQQSVLLSVAPRDTPTISRVVGAASFQASISPGEWVTIFGSNLAPDSGAGRGWLANEIIDGTLPVSLDHVTVMINGKPAAIAWAGPGQLNVQAPDDTATGIVAVKVTTSKGSANGTAQLQQFAPSLFVTTYSLGRNWVAATHANGSAVSPMSPAQPEEIISLYGSGFGPTNPPQPSGKTITPSQLAYPLWGAIGGQNIEVLWGGLTAPGLDQVNVKVPSLPAGTYPVVLSIGGLDTQSGVLLPLAGQ